MQDIGGIARSVVAAMITAVALGAGPAPAQTLVSPPPVPASALSEPIFVHPNVDLQFTPRFWYFFGSLGTPKPAPATAASVESPEFPMAGASLSARFAALPETTFVLTGLYGRAEVKASFFTVLPSGPPGFNFFAQGT